MLKNTHPTQISSFESWNNASSRAMACVMKARNLDDIDLEILALLQNDGRMTNRSLAEAVGLSPSPCLERVRRLEEAGFISRYMAVIDVEKLYAPVSIMAQITLGHQSKGQQAKVEEYLTAISAIVTLYEVSGDCDYIARIVTPTIADYQQLTAGLLENPELGIERIVSHVVMRDIKDFSGFPLNPDDSNS